MALITLDIGLGVLLQQAISRIEEQLRQDYLAQTLNSRFTQLARWMGSDSAKAVRRNVLKVISWSGHDKSPSASVYFFLSWQKGHFARNILFFII